jgi:hypothetical protein
MRNGQLDKMSLKDLIGLDAKIKSAIDEKRLSERDETRAAMEEMARKSGFTLGELFGSQGEGRQDSAEVSQPERCQPDLDRPWTPTELAGRSGRRQEAVPDRFLVARA